jgi:hypothetical protein
MFPRINSSNASVKPQKGQWIPKAFSTTQICGSLERPNLKKSINALRKSNEPKGDLIFTI